MQETFQTDAQVNLTTPGRKLEQVRGCCRRQPPPSGSSPLAGYSRQPGATLTQFICHEQVSILSVAQAQQKSDYSEFYSFSGQECTFLKIIQEGTCFASVWKPRQTPNPHRLGGSETCCFQLFFLTFSQKCPHRRESHFLRIRAIYLPSAPPLLSPVFTIVPNSGGLHSVILKSNTYSEALSHLLTEESSVFRWETRRAQSQDKPFRNNFSSWLKAAEWFVPQLGIISAARNEIKI